MYSTYQGCAQILSAQIPILHLNPTAILSCHRIGLGFADQSNRKNLALGQVPQQIQSPILRHAQIPILRQSSVAIGLGLVLLTKPLKKPRSGIKVTPTACPNPNPTACPNPNPTAILSCHRIGPGFAHQTPEKTKVWLKSDTHNKSQSYGMPKFQSYGMPKSQSYGMPKSQSYGMSETESYGMSETESYGMSETQSYGMHMPKSQPISKKRQKKLAVLVCDSCRNRNAGCGWHLGHAGFDNCLE